MARRELSPDQLAVVQGVRAALKASSDSWTRVRVACSGGADSLSVAAALAWLDVHEPDPLRASSALVVDHGLQAGSGEVTAGVVGTLRTLGLAATSVRVEVADDPDGLEAAARKARYAALARGDIDLVLLGHTMDDQAETVLLGLARGSGTRSLSGMPARWSAASVVPGGDAVTFVRPLLGMRRATTRQACLDWGLTPWDDPMNDDERFARVLVRRLVPVMDDVLGPGLVEALARTAALARADADHLDAEAAALMDAGTAPQDAGAASQDAGTTSQASDAAGLPVAVVEDAPAALRGRLVRLWLAGQGVTELSFERTQAVLGLVTAWRGQAGVDVPGGRRVVRRAGVLRVR